MTNPFLWRAAPDGIYCGPHLIRACSPEDAARTAAAHNRYLAEPAPAAAADLDDPSDGHEDAARAADDESARYEWFR